MRTPQTKDVSKAIKNANLSERVDSAGATVSAKALEAAASGQVWAEKAYEKASELGSELADKAAEASSAALAKAATALDERLPENATPAFVSNRSSKPKRGRWLLLTGLGAAGAAYFVRKRKAEAQWEPLSSTAPVAKTDPAAPAPGEAPVTPATTGLSDPEAPTPDAEAEQA